MTNVNAQAISIKDDPSHSHLKLPKSAFDRATEKKKNLKNLFNVFTAFLFEANHRIINMHHLQLIIHLSVKCFLLNVTNHPLAHISK